MRNCFKQWIIESEFLIEQCPSSRCIYKGAAYMGITQTSFYAQNSVVSAAGIRMDVSFIVFQECLRMFSTPSRLILEIADVGFRLFDDAANPHVGIRYILSSRFFQHLYMDLIDMQAFRFQQIPLPL